MSNDELKEALVSQRPVVVRRAYEGDIEFAYISAIIYRVDARRIYMQAECMDKSIRSLSLADPQSIFFTEVERL